jgi:hypothetical protein
MAPLSAHDAVLLARFTRDLRPFLAAPLSEQAAEGILSRRLETREERFLGLLRRAVYDRPGSPYLQLLDAAGCELGDVRGLVAKEGLEGTLAKLVEAGVYVTLDEFKGGREAVRGSRRFAFGEADFDNPLIEPHIEMRSGGTRGPGTSVKVSLSFAANLAVNTATAHRFHRLTDHGHAYWLLSTAITLGLRLAKLGRPPVAWFYPLRGMSLKLRAGAAYISAITRLLRCPMPAPRFIDLQEPERMAAWLAARTTEGKRTCLTTYASSAVRIADAAARGGVPLSGVCFVAFGEPVTEAKVRSIEASGARVVVHFGFTEGGLVGYSCLDPGAPDDVHLFSDAYELVQRPQEIGARGVAVDGFALTGLLDSAPKILLNAETGDYGNVERRGCGCPFEGAGLDKHISHIRSFEKLSSEGMTFAKSDLLPVLEEVLPERFGGSPGDYQLLEEESDAGVVRLSLLISPSIGLVAEAEVKEAFLQAVAPDGGYPRLGAAVWRRADALEVKREPPVATGAGKILPFHLVRH